MVAAQYRLLTGSWGTSWTSGLRRFGWYMLSSRRLESITRDNYMTFPNSLLSPCRGPMIINAVLVLLNVATEIELESAVLCGVHECTIHSKFLVLD